MLPDGREVFLFSLKNDSGMEVDIINYGGIVLRLRIPDRNKEPGDVVLGFDNLEDYLGEHPYFGAIVGRCANGSTRDNSPLREKSTTRSEQWLQSPAWRYPRVR